MNIFFKSWSFVVLFLIAVIALWIIGLIYFLPFQYWWFDVFTHFLGGLWVFSLILILKKQYAIDLVGGNYYLVNFLAFVGLVVFVGVIWELSEFVVDRYLLKTGFTHMRGVYEDTLSDLFMDIVGGSCGALIYLLSNKKTNA